MTDETKKLFDAPWEVFLEKRGSFYRPCVCSSDTKIASVCTKENANRLARLPELYDALMEAAGEKCWSCAGENTETMLDHQCPKGHDEDCYFAKWRELLRKVRDGEWQPRNKPPTCVSTGRNTASI